MQILSLPKTTIILIICSVISFSLKAQSGDTAINDLTLSQCIDYAMSHQPNLKQAQINQLIAKSTNAINLSGWYPQINASGTITHYIQLPTSYINENGVPTPTRTGIANTAVPGVSLSQAIFSPSLVYASKVAPLYTKQAQQITDSTKINVVVNVSKSFYNLLLTLQQINVLKEDTVRLGQSLRDAYHQYVGGIVDETDYEEATITLNNSVAQLKQATENVTPQYAVLKQAMGFPAEQQFNVLYDSVSMMKDINIDTSAQLQYAKRIEYQALNTQKDIQHRLTDYYNLSAFPTVSGFFDYDYEFENASFSKLFSNSFPYSYVGLTVSVPIFNGFYRVQNVRRSKLEESSLDWSLAGLKSEIYSEYTTALANYKSNLFNLNILKNNLALAKRLYFVVDLQYKQGIVAYLNVITAESNLITAEIGYQNALYQLLSSKIDLEKSMGNISY